MSYKLLLATNNKGKVREYKSLLEGLDLELVTPAEAGISGEIEETGSSLEENARLKAVISAARSGLPALADDSGLEVDALGGEPGVRSARYAGEGASDTDRVLFLLSKLENVPDDKRSARFRCVIALATPKGEVEYCSGECRGVITREPRGGKGFGYDPVFFIPEMGKTMAELSFEEKNGISHRARAARQVRGLLEKPLFSDFYRE